MTAQGNFEHYYFFTEENHEDEEVGGFFAYDDNDRWEILNSEDHSIFPRGYGRTPLEAIACLCAVLDEQDGKLWGREGQSFV